MHDTEKMSSSDQIARLFRPGAKYFNMNPFEVLGLPHTATADDVKRAYRRMSVQVKGPGDRLGCLMPDEGPLCAWLFGPRAGPSTAPKIARQ